MTSTQPKQQVGLADGPRGHWLFGCLSQIQREPLTLYTRTSREFGHHSRIRILPGIYLHLLTHPEAVEHVLVKHQKNYQKPAIFNDSMRLMTGEGILVSQGDVWLRHRRLMQPAFQRERLGGLGSVMANVADAFVQDRLAAPSDEVVDALDLMMTLTFRIAGLTLLGTDVATEAEPVVHAFREAFAMVSRRMNSPHFLPIWLPTPANLRFRKAKRQLDEFIDGIIATRRKESSRTDLLSLLLAAQDEETGTGMSDAQVRAEALTLLVAGHDTVGAALSWTWMLLGQHPRLQEDVADEVRGVLQGRLPTVDDLRSMPLLRATFDETLRLYPPAWGQPRQSVAADEINGIAVPAKSPIVIAQWVTQRHPDFWERPDEFLPERFLPGHAERHKFAYFPFGGGPRVCIGQAFALIEAPILLASILQRFRIELVAGQQIALDTTFTLRPREGVKLVFHRR